MALAEEMRQDDSEILIVDDKRVQEDLDNKAYETKDPQKFPDQAIDFLTKMSDELRQLKHLSVAEQHQRQTEKSMTINLDNSQGNSQDS